jgi:pimeloyl-ACP methyl ester carboxylesterase
MASRREPGDVTHRCQDDGRPTQLIPLDNDRASHPSDSDAPPCVDQVRASVSIDSVAFVPYTRNALDDARVRFEDDGGDGAAVVFHGGFLEPVELVRGSPIAQALPDDEFRHVYVDHRGHGRSDKPHDEKAYRMPLRVAGAMAVLDELGIDQAHFVGMSWGGRLGFGIGEHAPSRVGPLATRGAMRICGHCLILATREFDRSATPTLGKRSERRGRRRGNRDLLPRAEKALAEASSFARSMGHEVVADHHLLLGLMAVEEGVAAAVLTRIGLTMSSLHDAVLAIAPAQSNTIELPMGIAPGAKRMIEAAAGHATRLGTQRVGTEHLLMALVDQSVPVRELLIELGVDPDLVPTTIEEVLSG